MIDKALTFLLGELNGFLGTTFPASEPHAVLSSLVLPDGSAPRGIENKVVITITGIERETAAYSAELRIPAQDATAMRISPPLKLNIYFLLAANFAGDYTEALRLLSSSLAFLQSKSVFTPQNSAAFPRGLERLTVEMVNLEITEQQNLWAATGAKYLPSAYYKARMLTIEDGWVAERVPTITGTESEV
jgi:hypothetical protein